MIQDLRAPLVDVLAQLAAHLQTGNFGDPHVGFVVLVSADEEPAIVALTPRGPHDMRTLVSADDAEAEQDRDRFFTYEEFSEAEAAMDSAAVAMQTHFYAARQDPTLKMGIHIGAQVRSSWERRRQRPIDQALAQAETERRRPCVCDGCGRRFTERGISMHHARSTRCTGRAR